jgi:heptaprenylglyceryl phosphate synthase
VVAKVPSAVLADTATNATHATAAAALDKLTYRSAIGTAPRFAPSTLATAACDAGRHVVGGGVRVDDPANAVVDDSFPDVGGTAWTSRVGNGGTAAMTFTVFAVCTTTATTG